MRIVNKEVLTSIGFLFAFIVFVFSAYGVGKAESDGDQPLKDFATASFFISIAGMAAAWIAQYGLQTPDK